VGSGHLALAGALSGGSKCSAWQAASTSEQQDAAYQVILEHTGKDLRGRDPGVYNCVDELMVRTCGSAGSTTESSLSVAEASAMCVGLVGSILSQ
jgi:hypothetical protein